MLYVLECVIHSICHKRTGLSKSHSFIGFLHTLSLSVLLSLVVLFIGTVCLSEIDYFIKIMTLHQAKNCSLLFVLQDMMYKYNIFCRLFLDQMTLKYMTKSPLPLLKLFNAHWFCRDKNDGMLCCSQTHANCNFWPRPRHEEFSTQLMPLEFSANANSHGMGEEFNITIQFFLVQLVRL